jgi:acetyl-CoA carboxylase carboxyl transferase subunit beta
VSSWLDKIVPGSIRSSSTQKGNVPEGLWKKCPKCNAVLFIPDLDRNQDVCPKCNYHIRLSARRRIDLFLDKSDRIEIASDLVPEDRLKFKDSKRYRDRLLTNQKNTNEKDALIAFQGKLKSLDVVVVAFEFSFMGGSMGVLVGEKFFQAANIALKFSIPLICFSASGGARMQEALYSLMQMSKTAAVIEKMKMKGIPYISVLTDPVFGGVSASLAMLGDVNIAEPNALIGFAGPRVIEQTVREKLPNGFQRSEFLLEHGTVDMIVDRKQLRDRIVSLLAKLTNSSFVNDEAKELKQDIGLSSNQEEL